MPVQLTVGMGENFVGPCDLVLTMPYGQLHTKLRGMPMIISGFALRSQTYSRFAMAPLTMIGVWGKNKDQAVWVANTDPFEVDIAGLVEEEFAPNRGWFPLELPRRLLAAYKGKKDVVADPFMGRGTVGKAVLEYGGTFIGIDRDRERVQLAREYLK
jgi:hypothetical protein